MPTDIKITTELLYKGALAFALMDAVYISLLMWRVNEETFRRLKWMLVIAAALIWFGIWSWALRNFWETVYAYVFPAWAQTWVPWIASIVAVLVAFLLWKLALQTKTEGCSRLLSFRRHPGQSHPHLGGVSRRCHQAAHVAGSISACGSRHRVL